MIENLINENTEQAEVDFHGYLNNKMKGLNEAVEKEYTIIKDRKNKSSEMTGTLEKLIADTAYTLETGASYQNEKGNKKINRNPKNIKALVTALNNAVNNSAANGYSETSYSLK